MGGEKIAILLMDARGFNDSAHVDKLIFAFSTLISSVQILNISKMIRTADLQSLQFFTSYNEHAKKESGVSKETNPFQKLIFLIRDSPANDEFGYGSEEGRKYLETYLQNKQETKENLESTFDAVECCRLPYSGVRAANPEYHMKELHKTFLQELETFFKRLLNPENLIQKKIDGQPVSALTQLGYILSFTEEFRDVSVFRVMSGFEKRISTFEIPTTERMFERTEKAQYLESYRFCSKLYKQFMLRIIGDSFIKEELLEEIHCSIKDLMLMEFDKRTRRNFGMSRQKHRQHLQDLISREKLIIQKKNHARQASRKLEKLELNETLFRLFEETINEEIKMELSRSSGYIIENKLEVIYEHYAKIVVGQYVQNLEEDFWKECTDIDSLEENFRIYWEEVKEIMAGKDCTHTQAEIQRIVGKYKKLEMDMIASPARSSVTLEERIMELYEEYKNDNLETKEIVQEQSKRKRRMLQFVRDRHLHYQENMKQHHGKYVEDSFLREQHGSNLNKELELLKQQINEEQAPLSEIKDCQKSCKKRILDKHSWIEKGNKSNKKWLEGTLKSEKCDIDAEYNERMLKGLDDNYMKPGDLKNFHSYTMAMQLEKLEKYSGYDISIFTEHETSVRNTLNNNIAHVERWNKQNKIFFQSEWTGYSTAILVIGLALALLIGTPLVVLGAVSGAVASVLWAFVSWPRRLFTEMDHAVRREEERHRDASGRKRKGSHSFSIQMKKEKLERLKREINNAPSWSWKNPAKEIIERCVYKVSPDEQTIEHEGCTIYFPEDTFFETASLSIFCDMRSSLWPDNYIGITPIVDIQSDKPLQKSATMKLPTWCVSKEGQEVMFYAMHAPKDGKIWKTIAKNQLKRGHIEFQCREFSLVGVFVEFWELVLGKCKFLITGYVYKSPKDKLVHIGLCRKGKTEEKELKKLYDKNLEQPLRINAIEMEKDEELRITIKCPENIFLKPENYVFKMSDTFIRSGIHQKEFRIDRNPESSQDRIKSIPLELVIVDDKNNSIRESRLLTFAWMEDSQSVASASVPDTSGTPAVTSNTGQSVLSNCSNITIQQDGGSTNINSPEIARPDREAQLKDMRQGPSQKALQDGNDVTIELDRESVNISENQEQNGNQEDRPSTPGVQRSQGGPRQ